MAPLTAPMPPPLPWARPQEAAWRHPAPPFPVPLSPHPICTLQHWLLGRPTVFLASTPCVFQARLHQPEATGALAPTLAASSGPEPSEGAEDSSHTFAPPRRALRAPQVPPPTSSACIWPSYMPKESK